MWRYLWAAPCTAVGVLLALIAWMLRARWRLVRGVLEVSLLRRVRPHKRLRRAALPFRAITLGHVVIGVDATELRRWRAHEHVHVRQYERWGPLFFVAYPLASLWQLLRGRRPYWDNPFEVQARQQSTEHPDESSVRQ
jgi:hypothetical protein